jgi:hypothetical protein
MASIGRDLRRRGRLGVVAAVAVVIGACSIMLAAAPAQANGACTAKCSQYQGGMVAGGSQQVYRVFSAGQ